MRGGGSIVWLWVFVSTGMSEDVRDELLREAYERISALSQKVDFLLRELDDCMKNCFKSGKLAEDRRLMVLRCDVECCLGGLQHRW